MQDHASIGGSTAFGLNPRAFDVMAQQHAERNLDPRMMSRGFLGMPGGAEAARVAAGGGGAAAQPQVENRSKMALKNARKRANKKAAAEAEAALRGSAELEEAAGEAARLRAAEVAAAFSLNGDGHDYMCRRHSARRPLAWGPEAEGECLCAGFRATQSHNRAVPTAAPPPSRISLSGGGSEVKWAVYSRGGECSPDCSCPMGVSCSDRMAPPSSTVAVPEQEDDSGFASPKLTTAMASKGDFENLD